MALALSQRGAVHEYVSGMRTKYMSVTKALQSRFIAMWPFREGGIEEEPQCETSDYDSRCTQVASIHIHTLVCVVDGCAAVGG